MTVLINVRLSSYGYERNGQRVRKVENGAAAVYCIYSTATGQSMLEVNAASWTPSRAYVISGSQVVAQQSHDGNFYWLHQDHLSSARKLTNTAGVEVYRGEFDPHGQVLLETGSLALNNKKFTGYERDATGLDYAQARMYHHNRGRFMQPDPGWLSAASVAKPQTLNRYAYVNNDPVNLVDPTGLDDMPFTIYWLGMDGFLFSFFAIDAGTVSATTDTGSVPLSYGPFGPGSSTLDFQIGFGFSAISWMLAWMQAVFTDALKKAMGAFFSDKQGCFDAINKFSMDQNKGDLLKSFSDTIHKAVDENSPEWKMTAAELGIAGGFGKDKDCVSINTLGEYFTKSIYAVAAVTSPTLNTIFYNPKYVPDITSSAIDINFGATGAHEMLHIIAGGNHAVIARKLWGLDLTEDNARNALNIWFDQGCPDRGKK